RRDRHEAAAHDDALPAEEIIDLVDLEGDGGPAVAQGVHLPALRGPAVDPPDGINVAHRLDVDQIRAGVGDPPDVIAGEDLQALVTLEIVENGVGAGFHDRSAWLLVDRSRSYAGALHQRRIGDRIR